MEKIKYSDQLLKIHDYDELIKTGVVCSNCGKKLIDMEITMHRFTGIINPNEMMCQTCWFNGIT